ncbi:MAG: hypothetical protein QNJ55_23670 [Xenococcus sp. MO_188.B8]|nr:hypothetical protein [Xenococcus sp. MO_188.B8]
MFNMRSYISFFHDSPKNPSPEIYQIYYLFAFSAVGKQLIPFLRKLGLKCTEPKENPAQGTVSTLIFFENVYLEIFWFEKASHLPQSEIIREFNFQARVNWVTTGALPFGFGLSYSTRNHDNFVPTNFEASAKAEILISEPLLRFCPINLAKPEEPICYLVPDYEAQRNRLDRYSAIATATTEGLAQRQPELIAEEFRNPDLGLRKLTQVKIRVISDHLITPPLLDLAAQNFLEIEYRKHPLLDLTFDDSSQKRFVDLRPLIPIILRY